MEKGLVRWTRPFVFREPDQGAGDGGVLVTVGVADGSGVSVMVGVYVTVGVTVNVAVEGTMPVPATLMSTHQAFVPPTPMPNGTPLAFWNFQ